MTAQFCRPVRRGRVGAVVLLLAVAAAQVGTVPARAAGGSVSVDDVTVSEPTVGARSVVFVVSLARTDSTALVVTYATADGTAVAGQDYVATSGSLDFGPTGTTRTVRVPVLGDGIDEDDETFALRLTNTSPELTGTATIIDADVAPRLSIGDARVGEGSSGRADARFAVSLSEASGRPVSVGYATADGSGAGGAAAPGDYTATNGTLTFAPGERVKAVAVPVVGDATDEKDEAFSLSLSDPSPGVAIADPTGTGTILDDDGAPALSVSDAAATEGDNGAGPLTFTVSLDHPSSQNVTFRVETRDGTGTYGATAPDDYEALSSTTEQITAGRTSVGIEIPVRGDLTHEATETLSLVLSAEANATVARSVGTGTITDDDLGPDVTVADAEVAEGTLVGPSLEFKLALSSPAPNKVTVAYATADGTAVGSASAPDQSDYTPAAGNVVFSPGQTEKTVTVFVAHDGLAEGDETVLLQLSGVPDGIGLGRASATGTISNDDGRPDELSVNDISFAENDTGAAGHLFTVTRTRHSLGTLPLTVHYATADGTATAGRDYTPRTGVLVFNGSAATQTVSVSVAGDGIDEDDETLTVTLSSPTNAVLVKGTGTATILDDDNPPLVSVPSVTVPEGNAGPSSDRLDVTLGRPSSKPVTVAYALADGTATAADYRADVPTGRLTFAPGETVRSIDVSVVGDVVDEADETFTVTVSDAVNAAIAERGTATVPVVIADDDAAPALSVGDATTSETGAAAPLLFTVALDTVSGQAVTVTVDTADGAGPGGATAPGDYAAVHGRVVTIPAGVGATTVPVTVVDDPDPDAAPSETFTVKLSAPDHARLAADTGTGRIVDDDGPAVLSVTGDTVTEGTGGPNPTATFVVTLSRALTQAVTVDYTTGDGPAPGATAPGDYTTKNGPALTFAPGQTTRTIPVVVAADDRDEADEAFTLTLGQPADAGLDPAASTATATIVDDDGPTLTVADITVAEGDTGAGDAVFTVTLDTGSVQPVSVAYATADGTAGGGDFTATSGRLQFAPGDTSRTVTVPVAGDALNEGDEDFVLTLAGATGAAIADGSGRAVITDDDLSQLDIVDANVVEGDSGTADLTFTVTLVPPSADPVTVSFATGDETATAGKDYGAVSGGLTFNPGDTARSIVAPVFGDTTDKVNGAFAVTLSGASVTARLGRAVASGTIIDDDAVPDISSPDVSVAETTGPDTTAVFPVRLSGPRSFPVTVHYETVPGTASAPADFTPASGDLAFAPGDEVKPVPVTVTGDRRAEADETIRLRLSAAGNATIADPEAVATVVDDDRPGYLLAATDGGIFTFGGAGFSGSAGALRLNQPIVGLAAHPSGRGYWLVATDGGIFSFGAAKFLGSTGATRLNKPIVGLVPTPTGEGYWLVATDGGIFSFGDARFLGSTGARHLNKPIVGMAATPSGRGYRLVATDGGVFAFGDAVFQGSTGAITLNRPIVGMAATPSGLGYWLVATDGGIFAFGDAAFCGSTGALRLNEPIVGMAATPGGGGYWLAATDGGIFSFGDAAFLGSTGDRRLNKPAVGMSTL